MSIKYGRAMNPTGPVEARARIRYLVIRLWIGMSRNAMRVDPNLIVRVWRAIAEDPRSCGVCFPKLNWRD